MKPFRIALLIVLFPLTAAGQQSRRLQENHRESGEIDRLGSHLFSLRLKGGRAYRIAVEQKGIDLALTLQTAAGEQLRYQDSPNGLYGPEAFSFRPDSSGHFLLRVQALDDSNNSRRGRYTLVLREDRPAPAVNALLPPAKLGEDLALFRSIREAMNSGLYRYRSKAQIDSLYAQAAAQCRRPMRLLDFYSLLNALSDFEGSCHNNVNLPGEPTAYLSTDRGYFPLYLRYVAGAMVVNEDSAALPAGTRILGIDGMRADSLRKVFYKYFSTDGYNVSQKELASVNNAFGWRFPVAFGIRDSFRIDYRLPATDSTGTITLRSIGLAEKRRRFAERHSLPYEMSLSEERQGKYSATRPAPATALLNFRAFDMAANADDPAYGRFCDFLDSFFTRLRSDGVANLIIDIRGNPGGNDPNYEQVFTYLTDRPFRENTGAWILRPTLAHPEHYRWQSADRDNQLREQRDIERYLTETFSVRKDGRYYQAPAFNPVYQPDSLRFRGRLFLLIDENVASAASHFASLVRGYTDAFIIGRETTGGYYGHNGHFPVEYRLPNSGLISRFSIVHVTQDAPVKERQPPGRGIIPDLELEQSLEDFLRQEDTQLKAALRLAAQ